MKNKPLRDGQGQTGAGERNILSRSEKYSLSLKIEKGLAPVVIVGTVKKIVDYSELAYFSVAESLPAAARVPQT